MRKATRYLLAAITSAACAVVVAACGFDAVGAGGDALAVGGDAGTSRVGPSLDGGADGADPSLDGSRADSGAADADDASLPCSAQLATDPLNCGRCGHSCLGGACAAGSCQPTTLATRGTPHDITVDATNVYWTEKGGGAFVPAAARCPKAGGPVSAVATGAEGTNDLESLVVVGSRVYITDIPTNYVYGCKLPGPGCGDQLVLTENGPLGIASNGTKVFWVNGNSGNIRSADLALGGATSIVQNRPAPRRIAATTTKVAWTEAAGIGIASVDGEDENESATTTPPRDVAIDASFVYFATSTEVRRLTHGAGGDTLLATGSDIQHLIVDATALYFTERGNGGRVLRCPLAGCTAAKPVEVVAAGQASVYGVAVDATHVYWTNGTATNGTVRRVAK